MRRKAKSIAEVFLVWDFPSPRGLIHPPLKVQLFPPPATASPDRTKIKVLVLLGAGEEEDGMRCSGLLLGCESLLLRGKQDRKPRFWCRFGWVGAGGRRSPIPRRGSPRVLAGVCTYLRRWPTRVSSFGAY